MDAINMAVLAELQEYAQLYFSAIVGLHTVDGRCGLKPGKYTAKELADSNKAACGLYVLPQDPMFDEQITITAGTFNCEFPYRRIFAILAQWEAMSKAGKQKAVFEIGEVEEKSAKVLLNEKTELGAFKTKSVKLQRIIGNWWMPRKVKKNQPIELYYELNGVMLVPGKQVWSDSPTDPQTVKWCEQHNDEEVSKLLLSFISNDREGTQQNTPYYAEVVNRANIAATPAETPRISTETAETVNVSAEGEKGAEKAIYAFISKAEAILDKIKQKCLNREIYVEDASRYEFMVCMAVSNFVNKHKNCPSEPPQPPETPQIVECIADTSKPRETARKEPKQVIRNSRTTQRRTIKRFLIVQSVPRLAKCSTAHHIAGASKMVYSGIIPSGYAPPIRGDCKLSISTRAKPPNRASCEKINILQPP